MNLQTRFQETFRQLGEKLIGWLDAFILSLPNILAALVVMLAFWLAARAVRRAFSGLLRPFSEHSEVNRIFGTVGYLTTLVVGLSVALGVLHLSKTVTSLLAGAGIIGLALGLAFRDIAANFISGILLSIQKPFTVGDLIRTGDCEGLVAKITIRATELRTLHDRRVIIPNSHVYQNTIVVRDRGHRGRIDLPFSVAYHNDLDRVRRVALEAIADMKGRDTAREADLYYDTLGTRDVRLTVRFWVDPLRRVDLLEVRSRAIMHIKRAFDAHGIYAPALGSGASGDGDGDGDGEARSYGYETVRDQGDVIDAAAGSSRRDRRRDG